MANEWQLARSCNMGSAMDICAEEDLAVVYSCATREAGVDASPFSVTEMPVQGGKSVRSFV